MASGAVEGSPAPASLTVTDSTFSGNRAVAANGADDVNTFSIAESGALFVGDGSFSVQDSQFMDNLAQAGAAAANIAPGSNTFGEFGEGGAIMGYSFTPSITTSLSVTNCLITGNQALSGAGGNAPFESGVALGGGIEMEGGFLNITNTTVEGNQRSPSAGGDAMGGGIDMNNTAGSLIPTTAVIVGSTISGNQVVSGAGVSGGAGGFAGGGGINIGNPPSAVIGLDTSSLSLIQSTLSGNLATGGKGDTGGAGGTGAGGGVNVFTSGAVSLVQVDLLGNQALGGEGGAGGVGGTGQGGGVNINGGVVTMTQDSFLGNQALGGHGGTRAMGGTGLGGAINVGLVPLAGFTVTSALTLDDSTLELNVAQGGDGGDGGAGLGGGLALQTGASASITDSLITKNQATGGSRRGQGVGGGIYSLGMLILDAQTSVKKNTASTSNNNTYP